MTQAFDLHLDATHHVPMTDHDDRFIWTPSRPVLDDPGFQSQAVGRERLATASRNRQERITFELLMLERKARTLFFFGYVVHQSHVTFAQIEFHPPECVGD